MEEDERGSLLWKSLPIELVHMILLSDIHPKRMGNIELTCSLFRNICREDIIWSALNDR